MKRLVILLFILILSACGGDNFSNTSIKHMVLTNSNPVVNEEDAINITRDYANHSDVKLKNTELDYLKFKAIPINNLDGELRVFFVRFYTNNVNDGGALVVPVYEGYGLIGDAYVDPIRKRFQPLIQSADIRILERRPVATERMIYAIAIKTDQPLTDFFKKYDETETGRRYYLEPYYLFTEGAMLGKSGDMEFYRSKNPQKRISSSRLQEERKLRSEAIARGKNLQP